MYEGVGGEAEGTELPSLDAARALIPCGRRPVPSSQLLYPAHGTSLDLFMMGFGSICGLQHLVFSGMQNR